jgi:hypothetical protein
LMNAEEDVFKSNIIPYFFLFLIWNVIKSGSSIFAESPRQDVSKPSVSSFQVWLYIRYNQERNASKMEKCTKWDRSSKVIPVLYWGM